MLTDVRRKQNTILLPPWQRIIPFAWKSPVGGSGQHKPTHWMSQSKPTSNKRGACGSCGRSVNHKVHGPMLFKSFFWVRKIVSELTSVPIFPYFLCGMPPQHGLMSVCRSAPRIWTHEPWAGEGDRVNLTTLPPGQPQDCSLEEPLVTCARVDHIRIHFSIALFYFIYLFIFWGRLALS